ncbi:MAG TPA: tetratricopeptide repeat protein, partial [Ktedonobacteraceae bacterium]|nr:tetratricopeptide repeat protein [Ktedonobacteraceae bacterium]
TASQVTGVLRQAQTFQTQGRFNDAIDLCEQILESGFDRPDARYFLGWLYQEQQRWDEAIRQFQVLLNDPDYALSCYYALGQCYRARGDLRTATVHFDEAVDRVNLDALTVEESDQLVQLCQEAAEAHRLLGEQEQALTVYNALLGFLRSRGWSEQVAQVEFMLQQMQNAPAPGRATPPPQQASATQVIAPEQMQRPSAPLPQQQQQQSSIQDAATMAFNANNMPAMAPPPASSQLPASSQVSIPGVASSSVGELPDWLTGILSDADKSQLTNKQAPAPAAPPAPGGNGASEAAETTVMNPVRPQEAPTTSSVSWLTEDAKPGNATRIIPPEAQPEATGVPATPVLPASTAPTEPPAVPATPLIEVSPVLQSSPVLVGRGAEDLLSQMAGASNKDEALKQVAEAVVASTAA